MAEKDKVLAGKVKQSGIFSFSELYEFLYDWFNDENYRVTEKKYSEKILGDSKKVEVKKEDQKITMNSGTVEIKYAAYLVKDYENRWENQAFWKFLRGVYDRYIIRTRIDQYEDKVEDELREVVAQTKAFLALEARK